MQCVFCVLAGKREGFIVENGFFFSVYDIRPVNKGHSLVVLKRHESSIFGLSEEESAAWVDCLKKTRERIISDSGEGAKPLAFNVSINDGVEAGQSVFHHHTHLIPRYVKKSHAETIDALYRD